MTLSSTAAKISRSFLFVCKCPEVVQDLFRLFPSTASVLVVQLNSSAIHLPASLDLFTLLSPLKKTIKQQPFCRAPACFSLIEFSCLFSQELMLLPKPLKPSEQIWRQMYAGYIRPINLSSETPW